MPPPVFTSASHPLAVAWLAREGLPDAGRVPSAFACCPVAAKQAHAPLGARPWTRRRRDPTGPALPRDALHRPRSSPGIRPGSRHGSRRGRVPNTFRSRTSAVPATPGPSTRSSRAVGGPHRARGHARGRALQRRQGPQRLVTAAVLIGLGVRKRRPGVRAARPGEFEESSNSGSYGPSPGAGGPPASRVPPAFFKTGLLIPTSGACRYRPLPPLLLLRLRLRGRLVLVVVVDHGLLTCRREFPPTKEWDSG